MGDFRQRHVAALANLFVQGLRLCQAAGLVKVGPVALAGTKIKAKASKHTAMSYGRRAAAEQKLDQEGKTLLEQAQARAAAADAGYGTEKRGDELPAELARRESRLRTIREAQAALAQEAKPEAEAAAAAAQAKLAARQRYAAATGQKAQGRAPTVPDPAQARPEAQAQRTFTAPDSRMMKDGATTAFEQADTAQTAVASQAQIIVAAAVTPEANDKPQLVPMLGAVEANLGAVPEKASADTGFFSEATLTAKAVEGVDLSGPPERSPPTVPDALVPVAAATESAVRAQRRHKLQTPEGQAVYRMRKAIGEPVFGQVKEGRGFRRFWFRGLAQGAAEWSLICLTPKLLKLFRGRPSVLAA